MMKNKQKVSESNKKYYCLNKERLKKYFAKHHSENPKILHKSNKKFRATKKFKDWRIKNRSTLGVHCKTWQLKNKEHLNQYKRDKYHNDPLYRLTDILRSNFYRVLKQQNVKKENSHVLDLIGCSIKNLKKFIGKKFQPGMTWDNHGEWHIDHIKSCSAFNLINLEEQKKCFHYTNLQPLWAEDNLTKGDKMH